MRSANSLDADVASHPPSFDSLYRAHARYVWRVARAMGAEEAHLDDVVHDVFFVVQRRLGDFDPERSVRAWLAGITRNVVGHLRRSLARESRRRHALSVVRSSLGAVDEPSPYMDATRLVERFLDGLDLDKRIAFVLMDVEGLTAQEVAKVSGTNARTVYSRRREARRRFEAYVAALGPGDV